MLRLWYLEFYGIHALTGKIVKTHAFNDENSPSHDNWNFIKISELSETKKLSVSSKCKIISEILKN